MAQRVTNRADWSVDRDHAQLGATGREQEAAQGQEQADDHRGREIAHEQPAELRRPVEQHERADAADREAQDAGDLGQQAVAHGLETRRHGLADDLRVARPHARGRAREQPFQGEPRPPKTTSSSAISPGNQPTTSWCSRATAAAHSPGTRGAAAITWARWSWAATNCRSTKPETLASSAANSEPAPVGAVPSPFDLALDPRLDDGIGQKLQERLDLIGGRLRRRLRPSLASDQPCADQERPEKSLQPASHCRAVAIPHGRVP